MAQPRYLNSLRPSAATPHDRAITRARRSLPALAQGDFLSNGLLGSSSATGLGNWSGLPRSSPVDQVPSVPSALAIAVMVFQLRVVSRTPKRRSTMPR